MCSSDLFPSHDMGGLRLMTTRNNNITRIELKVVSEIPGFWPRVKYLNKRIQDINNQIFPLVNK